MFIYLNKQVLLEVYGYFYKCKYKRIWNIGKKDMGLSMYNKTQ